LGEALCDREGNVLATYTLFDDHNVLTTSIDEVNGRLLIAGSNVPLPVLMVAPYDPDRAPARSAEPVATTALDWARPGAVLRYAIADFDADDEYTFEVLEAGANLRLRVSAGATEVASNLRFGAKALERAKRFVAIAQESLDVDASVLQDDRVPPFLLSRGSARTLRDGGELPLSTEWTDEETLEAHPALARVTIDGVEQTVSAYEASSGGSVRLTFLADPTWPLLVERVEGDCSVQLLGVDLSRAQGTGGVAVDGQPPPEGSAKKRRFELVEAGSGKFWEIELRGSGFSVRFGRLGTGGQTQHKSFDSNAAASREADKLVREKTKKGYREV
jgi:predicted DNA-binding WGR domain protein